MVCDFQEDLTLDIEGIEMLLVLEVKGLDNLNLEDMEAGKKVKIEGVVQGMYFDENYIKNLEEKARRYDELFEDGFLQKTLLGVGLALNATHNTVTTDVPELCIEDDVHWRIDNSAELNDLIKLGKIIKNN